MPRSDRRKAKQWSLEDLSSDDAAAPDDDAAAPAPAPRGRGEPTERRQRKIRAGGTVTKVDSSDEDAPTTPTGSRAPGVVSIAHVADDQKKKTPGIRRKRQNARDGEEVKGDAPMEAAEEGETAEVPADMLDDVGGLAPFDNVPLHAPESGMPTEAFEKRLSIGAKGDDVDMGSDEEESEEAEQQPEELKCPNCDRTFKKKEGLTVHVRACYPLKKLQPVDDDAAAALEAFDTSYKGTDQRKALVVQELARYKPKSETKKWTPKKQLEQLRKLIANGAETLEKKDPVKPVVAWLANGGDGARKYLCLGGRRQAAKLGSLDYAGKIDLGVSGIDKLIKRVADGKEKHDIVGARWPTEGDWEDDTIIRIDRASTTHGRITADLGRIAQEEKDDRAKHAANEEAAVAADAAAFQDWCRVANALPNVGAPDWTRKVDESGTPYWEDARTGRTRSDDPWAFVATPRVALPAEPEARMQTVAGTYASRPRGRGLGDLISLDPAVRARAVAARTGGGRATYDALSRAPAWKDSV